MTRRPSFLVVASLLALTGATAPLAAAPAAAATPACTTAGPQVYCSMAWARLADPVLRPGASGSDVTWLQKSLRAVGQSTVRVTGRYDALTTGAVRNYQYTRRIPVTGHYDATTQRYLVAGAGNYRPSSIYLPRNPTASVLVGRSVRGRAIRAYQVGDPSASRTVLVIGQMHGNEKAGVKVVDTLRTGPLVKGVSMWVIPTMNPDGHARGTRLNARGVDLNRNWPYSFKVQNRGRSTYSGPRALSEPENRAVRDFILARRVDTVVALHQPYHAVDAYDARSIALRDALSRNLGLPISSLDCKGGCHGTMTQWINHTSRGTIGITVEFGRYPRTSYLTGRAPRGIVKSVGGSW